MSLSNFSNGDQPMGIQTTLPQSLEEAATKAADEMISSGTEINTIPLGDKKIYITTNRELIDPIQTLKYKERYFYIGFK